jgi:hypothetical protein
MCRFFFFSHQQGKGRDAITTFLQLLREFGPECGVTSGNFNKHPLCAVTLYPFDMEAVADRCRQRMAAEPEGIKADDEDDIDESDSYSVNKQREKERDEDDE